MENKLEHVGVLGMRWGVRRSTRGGSTGKRSKRKSTTPVSDDFKRVSALKKKKVDEMSNEEISAVIKRMDLQKRYKDLNPSKISKGGKIARNVLSTIGQVSAGIAGAITLAKIGSALMKKINIGNEVADGLNSALGG